jgi:hypothetical protein
MTSNRGEESRDNSIQLSVIELHFYVLALVIYNYTSFTPHDVAVIRSCVKKLVLQLAMATKVMNGKSDRVQTTLCIIIIYAARR